MSDLEFVWLCKWEGVTCVYATREDINEAFGNVHPTLIEETETTVSVPGYFYGERFPVWRASDLEDDKTTYPKTCARVNFGDLNVS